MEERRTVQKDMIYAALKALHNHPTAEQVCAYVQQRCPTVSRATVYRVLGAMAERGSVLRVSNPDGADHYDHQTHRHFHICCDRCGRVDDVQLSEPGDILGSVQDPCGYELSGYTLMFHGICKECQQTAQERPASDHKNTKLS